MIIVAQDKSLINMDKISHIYINGKDKAVLLPKSFHVVVKDSDSFYTIGVYPSDKEAQKQVDRIRQGIEEGWNTCAID